MVRTDGLARPNRFAVYIALPNKLVPSKLDIERLSLFAEVTSLPGVKIETDRLKIFGPDYIRPIGINYGDTIDITFIADSDLNIRRIFDDWIHLIVNENAYTVNYQNDYISQNINLEQMNTNDQKVYLYTLKDAFPIEIKSMELSQQAENQIQRITVTFAYRKWFYTQISNPKTDWTQRMVNNITRISSASGESVIASTTPLSNDSWYDPELYITPETYSYEAK